LASAFSCRHYRFAVVGKLDRQPIERCNGERLASGDLEYVAIVVVQPVKEKASGVLYNLGKAMVVFDLANNGERTLARMLPLEKFDCPFIVDRLHVFFHAAVLCSV